MAITNMKRSGTSMAGVSMLFFAVACGTNGSAPSASSDVSSVEAELAAATASKDSAATAATACFTTFKACKAAAAADDTACRTALEACLPAEPPRPSCDAASASDAGVVAPTPTPTAPSAPVPSLPTFGGTALHGDASADVVGHERGGHEGDGGVGPSADSAEHAHAGDAALAHDDADKDDSLDESSAGKGKRCEAPSLPQGALGECRATAASAMSSATDPTAVQSAHAKCVDHVFADGIAKLCEKAASLCAQASAPAAICTRITAACSAASSVDAGI